MHMSLSEILLILLVALLVIKPERLPEVATLLGKWVGGIRRVVAKFKQEVDQPLAKYSFHEDTKSSKE